MPTRVVTTDKQQSTKGLLLQPRRLLQRIAKTLRRKPNKELELSREFRKRNITIQAPYPSTAQPTTDEGQPTTDEGITGAIRDLAKNAVDKMSIVSRTEADEKKTVKIAAKTADIQEKMKHRKRQAEVKSALVESKQKFRAARAESRQQKKDIRAQQRQVRAQQRQGRVDSEAEE